MTANTENFNHAHQERLDKNPKYLNILSMMYISFLLIASILVHKMVSIDGLSFSASTFVFPFTYFFGDVIAEVYGYKISRQLIWSAFIAMFIFDIVSALLIKLPSPSYWHLQQSYNAVIGTLPRTFVGDFIGLNVGAFINVYCLTKWKILTRGRYFWIRSLCSTALGEAAFNIIAFSLIFTGTIPLAALLQAMVLSYIFKAMFAIAAVYPAVLLANFLKENEKIDIYDYSTNFNPFKLET